MTAASAIDTICQAIHDLSVKYDTDVTPTVRDYDEASTFLGPESAPTRIITVLPDLSGDTTFVGIGSTITVRWNILDRLWLKPAAAGRGIQDESHHIVAYAAAYAKALKAKRALSGQSHVSNMAFSSGVNTWGDTDWFTVDINLTVEEVITGA